jgi:hypothetical protein
MTNQFPSQNYAKYVAKQNELFGTIQNELNKVFKVHACESCHINPATKDSGANQMCDACFGTAQAIYEDEQNLADVFRD